jgi:hypothetical protein
MQVRTRANCGVEGAKVCRASVVNGIRRGRDGAVRDSRGYRSISGAIKISLVFNLLCF